MALRCGCAPPASPVRGRAPAGRARGDRHQLANAARGLPPSAGAVPGLRPAPDVPGRAPARAPAAAARVDRTRTPLRDRRMRPGFLR
ncbi:hypothetical protein G6F32_017082 [Rhizopus arrhizus]|nr:hypothetical protein G6F32_017082 [Rhizopus arrhizus]